MNVEKTSRYTITFKLIIGIVLSMLIISTAITFYSIKIYREKMEAKYAEIAFNETKLAAYYIDGDTIKQYQDTQTKDEYYETIRLYLLNAKKIAKLDYFYVCIPYEDYYEYIWDAGDPGEDGVCELGDKDVYYEGGAEVMLGAMEDGAQDTILITNSEEYGYIASAYTSIKDSKGNSVALASVDISMDMINDEIQEVVNGVLMVDALVVMICVVLSYFYFHKIVTKPLTVLEKSTEEIVNSNLTNLNEFKVTLDTNDEFQDLANSFTFMSKSLNEQIENLAKVTAEKERIGTELDVARDIQSSMLPCVFPAFPDHTEFDIYATMLAAKYVGGDFYDFFMVDKTHLALVMADVSGKGIPAALFMVIGKTLIKDHTNPGRDLGEVFTEVNNLLCEANAEGLFITAYECVIDLVTGDFRYVNAGHEMPIIKRKGEDFEAVKVKAGFVLAGMEGVRYTENTGHLNPGDRLYLYTDGVPEATNSNNELFNMTRTVDTLNKYKDLSPQELLPKVKEDIDEFVGDAPQFDDITMLCFDYKENMKI